MRWAVHVARMGEGRVVYGVLVGHYEGKRPLERPSCRGEDNVNSDLQKLGWGLWTRFSWLRIETCGGHL
jgi:hypothetical protein